MDGLVIWGSTIHIERNAGWWCGALALAAAIVGFLVATGHPLETPAVVAVSLLVGGRVAWATHRVNARVRAERAGRSGTAPSVGWLARSAVGLARIVRRDKDALIRGRAPIRRSPRLHL